jgi:hypothetical protein
MAGTVIQKNAFYFAKVLSGKYFPEGNQDSEKYF